MQKLYNFVQNLAIDNQTVIAIDGKCGSGKTTLASIIEQKFDVEIIHLDHFFLPLNLRTKERMAEPGGNVHYERFIDEVACGIKSKKPFTYSKFDCKEMDFTGNIEISNQKPIIIEGSYSLREDFREIYTKKIVLDISNEVQKERIIKRNGKDGYENFKNIWIPLENAYFEHFDIKNIADTVVEN